MNIKEIEHVIHGMLHVARPLEIARARHLLSDGTVEEVIAQLQQFQNSDGGFGHGLEPDFVNPHSSALQSSVAMDIIKEHAIDKFHPMVLKLIDYLENTFDTTIMRWHSIHPDNKLYPHAPWWHEEGDLKSLNPSAAIAGFIVKYSNPMLKIYKQATLVIDEALNKIIRSESIEPHELKCLIDMMNDIKYDYRHHTKYRLAKNNLILHIENAIEKNTDTWFTSYVTKPSMLITHHPSIGSELFIETLLQEIDLAFKHQNEEHLWDITWSWNDYETEFELAKKAWMGIIAYRYLKLIHSLGILVND